MEFYWLVENVTELEVGKRLLMNFMQYTIAWICHFRLQVILLHNETGPQTDS